jgi:hypothetical protein
MNWYSTYGLYAIIRDYAGCPPTLPLWCRFEHGWNPLPEPNAYDAMTDQPLMLVWSRRRLREWQAKSRIPAVVIGAPFVHYRKSRKIERDPEASGTVAFPAHSTRLMTRYSTSTAIAINSKLPERVQPVTVSLHIHDIERKKARFIKKRSQRRFAGPLWCRDLNCAEVLRHLRKFKYATSNRWARILLCRRRWLFPFSSTGSRRFSKHGDP